MLTGDEIELFLDRDAIEWGERWRQSVDSSLSGVAFFIAVLTPRYFRSAECRRELQFFARKARDLGVRELVLPLLYVDFPLLHEDDSADDLISLVRDFQWENWTELRFADRSSGEYRRAVASLAARLVRANEAAEAAPAPAPTSAPGGEPEDDDSPGLMDVIGAGEEAFPSATAVMERIAQTAAEIGEIMTEGTEAIQRADNQGKGMAGRLIVARDMSKKLADPAARNLSDGNALASHLHDIDGAVRTLIDRAPVTVDEGPEARQIVCEFFENIRELSVISKETLGNLSGMIDAITPIENMSRDLRAPLRLLRQGLTVMVEAIEVTEEWVQLIDASPVECDNLT